jgi:hypothetical protein
VVGLPPCLSSKKSPGIQRCTQSTVRYRELERSLETDEGRQSMPSMDEAHRMLTAVSIDWLNRELIVRTVVATRSTEGNGRRGSQRVCGYLNGDAGRHMSPAIKVEPRCTTREEAMRVDMKRVET